MKTALRQLLAVAAAAMAGQAAALDTTMTPGGFTGLGITPNAHLLGWGRFEFTYDNQLPGAADPSGNNFIGGFGLFPNFEVSGRIAANTMHTNCFAEPCGLRDLSASAKVGIGLDSRNRFRIAGGVTDIGGAATNFRSAYGVVTFNEGPFEASAGFARRDTETTRARALLDGPFAGAAWQPLPWLRGQVEYVDSNAWAGVRLFAPGEWLPEGWSAHVGANVRLTDDRVTDRSWITAGLQIPLYKVPKLPAAGGTAPLPVLRGNQQPLPAYEARSLPPPPVAAAPASPAPTAPLAPQAPAAPAAGPSDDDLRALADVLRDRGLEDISVGRMADGSIAIRANNATYNWNSVDALGAGLGGVARQLGGYRVPYRFVLTQRQVPLVAVTGQTDCLRQWIANENSGCAAGQLSTPGTMPVEPLQAGADWVVRGLQPSWKTLRVALTPVLRTAVATEAGVLDYSAGLNVGLGLPLWTGAIAEWRVQGELAHSDDFGDDGVLGRRAIPGGTERLALTQTVRVPLERWLAPGDDVAARRWGLGAVTAQATLGRIGSQFDGGYGALRWEPGDGRHRITIQGGIFDNANYGRVPGELRTARPFLGTYRYNVAPTRTYLEATGGQFMNNDRGFQLGLRQWFGDVSVQAYVKRTEAGSVARNIAGLELTVPITRRRDMNPGIVQVTGTPRFGQQVETVVGSGANVVTSGRGVLPPVPSLDALYNSDRAGLLYFEDNIRRIRDAAR